MKRGFTLAEVMIVLTVIGFIAAVTVPTLQGGVDEAKFKTGYKKAFATVSNIVGILKADDSLPQAQGADAISTIFIALDTNLEVRGYAKGAIQNTKATTSDKGTALTWGSNSFGDTEGNTITVSTGPTASTWSPWIIAQDNMAYRVFSGAENDTCYTKAGLEGKTNITQPGHRSYSCAVVEVDTNGLDKLPNKLEPQIANDNGGAGNGISGRKMNPLTGDRYYVYITKNGVAIPNPDKSVAGRIITDQK